MRNLLSNLPARPAAPSWLRAGVLVLLLATGAALVAPNTRAQAVQDTGANAAIATVDVVHVYVGGFYAPPRDTYDAPMEEFDGVHAWAG
jgi:hypothetical protein